MNTVMNLRSSPFEMIKSGRKTIELRLYDEKRKLLCVGDTITFVRTDTLEEIKAVIVALHRFASFAELYEALPLLKCGYTEENIDTASPSDMDMYYSPDKQSDCGVLGIEISLL